MTGGLDLAGGNEISADDRPVGDGGGKLGGLGLGKDFVQENVVEVLAGCAEADLTENLGSIHLMTSLYAGRRGVDQFRDHGAHGYEFPEFRPHLLLGLVPCLDFFCRQVGDPTVVELGQSDTGRKAEGGLDVCNFPYLLIDAAGLALGQVKVSVFVQVFPTRGCLDGMGLASDGCKGQGGEKAEANDCFFHNF